MGVAKCVKSTIILINRRWQRQNYKRALKGDLREKAIWLYNVVNVQVFSFADFVRLFYQ